MEFWINLWNIISAFIIGNIVAIIAVLVSLILFIFRTKRKGFSYYIESASAVVSVEEKVADQVEVSFGGNKVENVHLIVMTIRNSGNQSIQSEDFINPVNFGFGWDALILSSSIVETEPPSLDPIFNLNSRTIELSPLLLNGGDNFTVNFLVSNWDPDALEVHGRIVGVKDIKLESEVSIVTKILASLAVFFFVLAIILMIAKIVTLTQGVYIVIFSYILMTISFIINRENIKRIRAYIKNYT